ncbi:MAG: isoprenoid biosynthesis glyoxalase ElbB [Acidobacteriota bacterium]|jgi:enhancing lycopene biosynthesis protein 2|nr:isoprenoid biosynthesis glyoxalase ElbB [Acidobacteriota bacterium]
MEKKRVGVLLSGCGVMDGSEIHEATLTLYFLDKEGAEIICMAPDKDQRDVVNHISGEPVSEKRNVMAEAARIARGKIQDVRAVKAVDIDALVIPGGFGAAKNLCSFAVDGAACKVDENVAVLLRELHESKKPIGALCIAPAVIAGVFGKICAPEITIGSDAQTAAAMETMGARHKTAAFDEIVVDSKNRIVTTPCYMTAQSIQETGAGIEKLVAKIMEMINS